MSEHKVSSSEFVHLHVHTEYSILDSTLRIKELVKKAESYHMSSLAMTDNSTLFGVVTFYETCLAHGIKPIIGIEAYVAPNDLRDKKSTGIRNESFVIVLLAKNDVGYKNLNHLVTVARFEGFYYRPRIDKELLKQYSKGLICLSGSIRGEIPSLILENRIDDAKKVIKFYLSIFGKEDFYLELLDHGLAQEQLVNQKLIELGEELGVSLVAGNDCRYMEKEDPFAFEVAGCIKSGHTLNETRTSDFSGNAYNFRSPEEMIELFKDTPQAITNTLEIARRCNFQLDLESRHLPEFIPEGGSTQEEFLLELCNKGMKGKVDPESTQVQERLKHELKIIKQMGFIAYFLIVWDFINFAKQNGIPVGPGRGSAAGSLIAYLLGITGIDPLKYDLLFERFLNPERISMPDIDIDFCNDRRSEVIEYVSRKYGKKTVAQIITFGTLASRAVIRDVGRVMGIDLQKVDMLAKLIPGEAKNLYKAFEIEPKLQEIVESDKEVEGLFDIAKKLEGLPRNISTHAAGVIISKGDLTDKVALYTDKNGEVITQFDGPSCEKIGLLKMDFLGLRTLTVLENALKMVKRNHDKSLINNLSEIPIDDKGTYALLNKGNTLGVFQLESTGMRDLMKRLGVKGFQDIVALVALYRPGPMQFADDFIQRKHGKVKVEFLHPSLEDVLKETYGIMLYQEQVMKCAQVIAGFSLAEADNLRRIMGKKKAEAMKQLQGDFISGAIKKKVDKDVAEKVFEQMEFFAGYGFNKSHSVAYGWIAYQTAWFKSNYPKEYMASLLSSEKNNQEKISFYIEECKVMGIDIKPPSIIHSYETFIVEGKCIRYGLCAVKNIGEGPVTEIITCRKNKGTYLSLEDFVKKVNNRTLNKKVLESLIKSGALDEFDTNRRFLLEIVDDLIKFGSGTKKDQEMGQSSFLDFLDSTSKDSITPKRKEDYPNWSEHELLKFEKELLGCYMSGHPLGSYSKILRRFSTSNTNKLQTMKDGSLIKIGGIVSFVKITKTSKKNQSMAIVQLEDLKGNVEVVMFPRIYEKYEQLIKADAPIFVQGIIQFRNNIAGIIADDIYELDRVQEALTTVIYILVDEKDQSEVLFKLKNIVEKYPGSCQVVLDLHLVTGQTVIMKTAGRFSIIPSDDAIEELEQLFGENSVWFHIKDKHKQRFSFKKKI